MSKTPPKADKPTIPAAGTPAALPLPMPMPTQGGCYIRLPDGSLIPDDTTQQAPAPAQE